VAALLAALLAAVATGAGTSPVAAQNPPPHGEWRTFRTTHFRVTYQDGLEDLARRAAGVAEATHAALARELARPPRGPIELVVTDHVDFSNGFATPFASNRVVVFARPPAGTPSLGFSRDWLELVVAHEIVHIFHMDEAGRLGRLARGVLGRIPMVWPLFPSIGTPIWNIEGLATFYETRLTGGGRARGSYHDMVIRVAALEAGIPSMREMSAPSPVWPGGERSYIYGAALMDWIAEEYGPEAHGELVEATARSVLPTFLFFDRVSRRALGRSFSAIYQDWRVAATDSALALRARLETEGLTVPESVVPRGPYAVVPRVSPDGRFLSYAAHDYRSDPATRLLDLETGEDRLVARRNQFGWLLGPASWLPDGSGMVTAQLEYRDLHHLLSDLWLVDREGRERRLTEGRRIAQPDVAPDGRRVVAVQTEQGAVRLVEYDLQTGEDRILAHARPGEAFDAPRWAPDGRRVAVARFAGGRLNVVLVDAATGEMVPVTDDDAMVGSPAWSPDGRWVVFWSDRTGIPNLFAADASAGPHPPLHQVTSVLGGAFGPEVSPDGSMIYFAGFHHDGWHLERIPFDPAAWRLAGPPAVTFGDALLPPPTPPPPPAGAPDASPRPSPVATPAGPGTAAHPYSPLPTLRPYFWGPTYRAIGGGVTGQWSRYFGLYTMGWDVLQRHTWTGAFSVDPTNRRWAGDLAWTWAGAGTPDLAFRATRRWQGAGWVELPDESREAVLVREEIFGADATFWRRRWRNTSWLGVGGDVRRHHYRAHALSDAALDAAGITLRDLPGTASLVVRPGFSNVRQHPLSISREDGFVASLTAGRWWDVSERRTAYDQVRARLAAYRGHHLWGFADHVLAFRVAGLLRTGPDTYPTSIGGTPSTAPDLMLGYAPADALLPVRGFRSGDGFGTRAWTTSLEYRFPIHMRGAPRTIQGFSLTSASGALFADAGDAWCSAAERLTQTLAQCPAPGDAMLASAGAEIALNLGVFQNFPLLLRYGVAVPLQGPADRPVVFHVGFGPSF
jgi:Tol biopolymer transport system component